MVITASKFPSPYSEWRFFKFSVSKVVIEGSSIYDEGNIRRTLPELREGESPNFKRLAVQTAIANENPNKQVQVGLREAD